MKLSILQQDLLPSLSSVSRSVGARSDLPVLANVLIQTEDGKLKLSATNLEVGVIKKVNAKVSEDGEISVPAKTFLEVISSLSAENIDLEASSDILKISTPKFRATLNGISATEFPTIPLASDQVISLDFSVFKKAIPEISFAAAVDEGRPVLTGILTQIEGKLLTFVATDGFRLAFKKMPLAAQGDFRALIPKRTLEEVVRLADEEIAKFSKSSEEKIEIATSENQNQIIFKIGQAELSSRLIEGNFPNWEKIIPQKFGNRTIIERGEFLKAVKLASVFAKDAASIVKILASKDKFIITSSTKELGEQETSLEAEVEGEEIIIAFNSRFLIEAISACSSTQLSIEFSGNLSPALIKPIGEEGLEYIIMPVRVS